MAAVLGFSSSYLKYNVFLSKYLQNCVIGYHSSQAYRSKIVEKNVPYESSIHTKDKNSIVKSTFPAEADAVVIGGGSVGCSTAYHLAKFNGGNVVLLEKDRITSGTTWHTAGILRTFRSSESETIMQQQTLDLISNILPNVTGEDAGFIKTGTVYTAKSPQEFQDVKQHSSFAKALGCEIVELQPHEINDIHPLINVKDVYGAVYSPLDGTMDPATYCMSYIKALLKLGAKVIENCAVTKVTTKQDSLGNKCVSAVETTLGTIRTNTVINCTGAWAPYIGKMVGVRIPQLTYRHAYVVTQPIPGIVNTPMVKDHGKVYIKPQGAALQFGGYEPNPHLVEDLPHNFAFGLYDLDWDVFEQHYSAATNRIPAIENAGIRSTVCGPEAFTTDGKPNMGEAPEVRGFYLGSAFNSGGMMMGGGAGRQLAYWAYYGRPEIDLTNCDVRRHPTSLTNYNKWLVERCHEKFVKRYSCAFPYDHSLGGRNQRKTKLHDIHISHGALMGSRMGFERPAYYVKDQNGASVNDLIVLDYTFYGNYGYEEHNVDKYCDEVMNDCTYDFPTKSHKLIGRECLNCRSSAALFDSSYMGKLYLVGSEADAAVKKLLTRDVTQSGDGKFVYSLMLNDAANIVCDVIATKVKDAGRNSEYYITTPSSAVQYCHSHMKRIIENEGLQCLVEDRTEQQSILSIQGPNSGKWLQSVLENNKLPELKYGDWVKTAIAGKPAIIGRLSFVGELGYEIHCSSEDVEGVCKDLLEASKEVNGCLAGYRAMNSLSTETGFHHWPHSVNLGDNPVESRLLKFCDKSTDYVGGDELNRLRSQPLNKKLACFTVTCDVPLYGTEPVWRDDVIAGYLRVADYAHALQCNIGYGYVEIPCVNDDVILSGNYAIERMGIKYPAEVHVNSPFDPGFNRMMGKYSEEEQDKLKQLINKL